MARSFWGVSFWLVTPIAAVVLGAAVYYGTRAMLQSGAAEREKFEALYADWLKEIAALPSAEVEQRAQALLADATKFDCVPGTGSFTPPAALAPKLAEFLTRYESVHAVDSEEFIDRRDLAVLEVEPLKEQFLNIGTGECLRLYVKPGEETIYEVDTLNEDAPVDTYPTIHHWVLMQDRLMTADWDKLLA